MPAAVLAVALLRAIPAAASDLTGDLAALLAHFPGEYDNYAQWEGDVETNVTAADAHAHLHSIFFGPVALPSFGDHIYYVQQYLDGLPSNVYRQRLYSWSTNATAGSIVLSFFDFKDPAKYVDAHLHAAKLAGLTVADTTRVTPSCDVHIKRDADGVFRGGTTRECVVASHRTGRPLLIEDTNEFGTNYVSIHERGYDAETGARVFGTPAPDVLNRTRAARRFAGWVAVEPKPGEWGLMSNVSVWDAGQVVPVVLDTGARTKFALELAYCTYPNGDNVLKVAVHEEGFVHDGKVLPVAYAWSDPEAKQIGINLRFIQAGFTLVETDASPAAPAVLV